ncbi:F-box protein At5g39250 [Lactuca sativa]|nr:F-box protein At5g39250 [Lactuca sativa]
MSNANSGAGKNKMSIILKAVFPLLEGTDLAACMVVCKQWENVAQDDYLWKCLCIKKWPSISASPLVNNYRKIFKALCICEKDHRPTSLAPGISLSDLDFYIDIWDADEGHGRLLFSEIASGPTLREGNMSPPDGIVPGLTDHLEGPEYKLTLPVKSSLSISSAQEVRVSVLIARKDSNKVACILNHLLDCNTCIDWSEGRAIAYAQIAEFPLACPFVNFATSNINCEISLLFISRGGGGQCLDVFGIEMNFLTAYTEEGVLWLLSMLQWQ